MQPKAAADRPRSPSQRLPSTMQSTALAASPRRVRTPALHPKTRAMLVAPALPLPKERMSLPNRPPETMMERLSEPIT